VGKRYLDLPFLLLARLGTLAKVITASPTHLGRRAYLGGVGCRA